MRIRPATPHMKIYDHIQQRINNKRRTITTLHDRYENRSPHPRRAQQPLLPDSTNYCSISIPRRHDIPTTRAACICTLPVVFATVLNQSTCPCNALSSHSDCDLGTVRPTIIVFSLPYTPGPSAYYSAAAYSYLTLSVPLSVSLLFLPPATPHTLNFLARSS